MKKNLFAYAAVFFVLLIISAYAMILDLDIFITGKTTSGSYSVLTRDNSSMEVVVGFFNEFNRSKISVVKSYEGHDIDKILKTNPKDCKIIYTKWFDRVYVNDVKKPRFPILIFEGVFVIGSGLLLFSLCRRLFKEEKGK